jgi:DNA-binding IclR family transcriptional regulator
MRRPEDGRYVIGRDLLRLGTAAEAAELLPAVSRRPLKRVAEETRETNTLSVLRGRPAFDVVLQIETPHVIQAVKLGSVRPPAGLPVIADELEDGLASVSVPILGADRRLLGTLNVTGPSFRFDVVRRRAALEHARVAVAEIETRLGRD